jgi:hypothetical protein
MKRRKLFNRGGFKMNLKVIALIWSIIFFVGYMIICFKGKWGTYDY